MAYLTQVSGDIQIISWPSNMKEMRNGAGIVLGSGTFDQFKFLFPSPRCLQQSSVLIIQSSQAFLL